MIDIIRTAKNAVTKGEGQLVGCPRHSLMVFRVWPGAGRLSWDCSLKLHSKATDKHMVLNRKSTEGARTMVAKCWERT